MKQLKVFFIEHIFILFRFRRTFSLLKSCQETNFQYFISYQYKSLQLYCGKSIKNQKTRHFDIFEYKKYHIIVYFMVIFYCSLFRILIRCAVILQVQTIGAWANFLCFIKPTNSLKISLHCFNHLKRILYDFTPVFMQYFVQQMHMTGRSCGEL